jgi:hypothetical protein
MGLSIRAYARHRGRLRHRRPHKAIRCGPDHAGGRRHALTRQRADRALVAKTF